VFPKFSPIHKKRERYATTFYWHALYNLKWLHHWHVFCRYIYHTSRLNFTNLDPSHWKLNTEFCMHAALKGGKDINCLFLKPLLPYNIFSSLLDPIPCQFTPMTIVTSVSNMHFNITHPSTYLKIPHMVSFRTMFQQEFLVWLCKQYVPPTSTFNIFKK
jgi:hypothetical protein